MTDAFGPREWVLDSTGTKLSGPLRISRMEWVPNAANDDLLVSNSAGDKIWEVTNALAGGRAGVETFNPGPKGHQMEGFVVTTIGGGTLYVWLM